MRSHVDPDATEGCQTGSPQVASMPVYGIISDASYEYQRLKCKPGLQNQMLYRLSVPFLNCQLLSVTFYIVIPERRIHRFTYPKGIHSYRYFLQPMRTPNLLMHIFILPNSFVICSCMYASLLQLDLYAYTMYACMRTPWWLSYYNSQAKCIMQEQMT